MKITKYKYCLKGGLIRNTDLPNQNFEKHKDLDGDFEKNTKIYTEILKKT